MSIHCLFCGGQNPPKGMVYKTFIRIILDEYIYFNRYGEDAMVFPKLNLGYAHDCCLIHVLNKGQDELQTDGEVINFSVKIKKFSKLINKLARASGK